MQDSQFYCAKTCLMLILCFFVSTGLRPHYFARVVGRMPGCVSEYTKVVRYQENLPDVLCWSQACSLSSQEEQLRGALLESCAWPIGGQQG